MARSKKTEQLEIYVNNEVHKIFDMFRVLRRCYESLPDKSCINPDFVLFDGFDGNNEFEYLKAAESIACGDPTARAYDSHMRRLPWYQLLMQRWHASSDVQNLTHADLVRITAPTN